MTFSSSIIKKDALSVVSILNELDYQTVALHPNTKDFFNRNTAYQNLGFQDTIFSEDLSIPKEAYIGEWVNDEYCYNALKQNFENRDKTKPYFALVVTTQNHGAYNTPYDDGGVSLDYEWTTDGDRQLQSYLNLEKTSIDAFVELLGYFEKTEEDTIIVMWGDHCPGYSLFGMDFDLENIQNLIALHSTPIIIWDNFELPKRDLGYMASYKISPYILSLLGVHRDVYMEYLNENDIPNILGQYEVWGSDQFIGIGEWNEKEKETWNNLKLLQYDRLFGKKYSSLPQKQRRK